MFALHLNIFLFILILVGMLLSVDDVVDFLRENFGKFLIVLGLVLFFSGLLLFNTFGTFWSALSMFLGVVLAAFGFFSQLELFSDLRSLSGLGNILLFVSIVFFALSFALFQFLEVTSFRVIRQVFQGGVLPFSRVILYTERPYLWLCGLFFWFGFFSFAGGLVIKIVRFLGFV